MAHSDARVSTPHAEKYIKQLCKHWSHKFPVTQEGSTGHIDFGDGRTCALTATDDTLAATLTADADALARLQDVVAEHINRFAHREGTLTFDWQRAAG